METWEETLKKLQDSAWLCFLSTCFHGHANTTNYVPRALEILRRCLYHPFRSPGWPCSWAESSKDQTADQWKSSFKGMPWPLVRAGHKVTSPHSQDLSSHASLLGLAFTLNIQVFVGNTSSTSLFFIYLEPSSWMPLWAHGGGGGGGGSDGSKHMRTD